jgi:hypothetical protein
MMFMKSLRLTFIALLLFQAIAHATASSSDELSGFASQFQAEPRAHGSIQVAHDDSIRDRSKVCQFVNDLMGEDESCGAGSVGGGTSGSARGGRAEAKEYIAPSKGRSNR